MDRVSVSEISELALTKEGLDIYKAHLGDFSYNE